ncbi:ribose 5-phosphate isomerase B [Helicobacter sp. MIT 00-7814]|uniref:ribose 5-phosphate isomerase B n=1 Tax=unclassified Helicobacter TaxID=2593540 RepID=UPI000E1EE4E4|nr:MULTISPECIES: ribose 5-phosphate isomerase B [unclassified Helicobacter]RDU54390.1 ribose 5-phosphate isomerase B [Helicobacter sp. MIT 99-10781]RDU54467.1 ribose 5-phosphate isomerase B [Helicobacter sp. MIT 00-7814]
MSLESKTFSTIFLASDHAGFELKNSLVKFLQANGINAQDLGTSDTQRVDYPDYAFALTQKVKEIPRACGILVCGSGIGMSIAANRVEGIRAALCSESLSAKLSRAHNNANVLCLGGRLIGETMAQEIVEAFLSAEFEGGRHSERVKKLDSQVL